MTTVSLSAAGQSLNVPTEVETPSLVVDVDIFETNIRDMVELCRETGVTLYPHAKTHRTVEYAKAQMAAGADGLTVATLEEAEAFAAAGVEDLVIAFPLVTAEKLTRARRLMERTRVVLATDSITGAQQIARHCGASGAPAEILLIIDSGLRRVGVEPSDAPAFATRIVEIEGVTFSGIMTHEGSVYSAASRDDLISRSRAAAELMVSTADAIRKNGIDVQEVSLGASASVRVVVDVSGVTQVRPGIYAFNDLGQVALGNATPGTCAARVVATVVSHPSPDRACIDAGSKTLSQDRLPAACWPEYSSFGYLADLPGWELYRLSEEHGWLQWADSSRPPAPIEIGQRVQIIPNHICTAFSSSGSSIAVRNGEVIGRLPTIPRYT